LDNFLDHFGGCPSDSYCPIKNKTKLADRTKGKKKAEKLAASRIKIKAKEEKREKAKMVL